VGGSDPCASNNFAIGLGGALRTFFFVKEFLLCINPYIEIFFFSELVVRGPALVGLFGLVFIDHVVVENYAGRSFG
jgi:hypothetical protein